MGVKNMFNYNLNRLSSGLTRQKLGTYAKIGVLWFAFSNINYPKGIILVETRVLNRKKLGFAHETSDFHRPVSNINYRQGFLMDGNLINMIPCGLSPQRLGFPDEFLIFRFAFSNINYPQGYLMGGSW